MTSEQLVRENVIRGIFPYLDRNICYVFYRGYKTNVGDTWDTICGYSMWDSPTVGCYCCGRKTQKINFNPFDDVEFEILLARAKAIG